MESAHFSAPGIFKSARRYQLNTDASIHFGRGTDPLAVAVAPTFVGDLLMDGGVLKSRPLRAQLIGKWPSERTVPWQPDRLRDILGVGWSDETMRQILESLDFRVQGRSVIVPSFRHDVAIIEDLAEEVARVHGVDTIPSEHFWSPTVPGVRSRKIQQLETLRDIWVGLGYWEAASRAFSSPERNDVLPSWRKEVEAVQITNPLREEERSLRLHLLPSLLEIAAYNQARSREPVRFFEVAPIYFKRGEQPQEEMELAVVMSLQVPVRMPKAEEPTIWHLKGEMEWTNKKLGWNLHWDTENIPDFMHPGRTLSLYTEENQWVGFLGELRPSVAKKMHVRQIAVLSIALDAVHSYTVPQEIRQPSRYPEVLRDLSLVIPSEMLYREVEERIAQAQPKDLARVFVMDQYEGSFGKSVTLRL
ncbi:MAG: phenylalanine--tRNA ligase subunit beta, partial [Firmicutes bacterium]|nr:phenylalanine--tRNA ligase subunit beta [Bacillota bacterium]